MDNPVPTVFDLLGLDENDMTFAIPWGMAQSPAFLRDVAPEVTQTALDPDDAVSTQPSRKPRAQGPPHGGSRAAAPSIEQSHSGSRLFCTR